MSRNTRPVTSTLRTVGELLLPAIAYGDAAGLPSEDKSAAEIVEQFGRITGLISPSNRLLFRGKPAGTWSDDTQLSLAVADSLVEAGGFDSGSQAKHLIRAYQETLKVDLNDPQKPLGWGKSTTDSVLRLMRGVPPGRSGKPGAITNGVVMKLAPLVFWQYARGTGDEQRYVEIDALTRMTHDSDVAVVCSRVHADVLTYCLEQDAPVPPVADLAKYAISRAESHQDQLRAEAVTSDALNYLAGLATVDSKVILENTDGKGFDVPQTLAMAYGTFLSEATYAGRVYAGVNIGGDTDSIASIVSTMSLFYDKTVEFPADVARVYDYAGLVRTSMGLARAALAG